MPSLQPLSTYRVTGYDGEMIADPSGEWVHVDDVRAALATQQAVQGETVALSENPITARAQVVSMRIKARDKDPYRPGNDVPATPSRPLAGGAG